MLPSQHRLRRSLEIKLVLSGKEAVKENGLFLKARRSEKDAVRFAVVVSTKVARSAVRRNRIKRLLREAISGHLLRMKKSDCVLVALPGIKVHNISDANILVSSILRRARLL